MSNLVKAIKAHEISAEKTAAKKPLSVLMQELVSVDSDLTSNNFSFNSTKVYEIGVRFGKKCFVTENEIALGRGDVLRHAIETTKQGIIEAVFGEFREDFIKIKIALLDYDYEKAAKLLADFETKMFSET